MLIRREPWKKRQPQYSGWRFFLLTPTLCSFYTTAIFLFFKKSPVTKAGIT
jgi:hypothetical protein